MTYDIDRLFRSSGASPPRGRMPAAASGSDARVETLYIAYHAIAAGNMSDADRGYLAALVAAQTGISAPEAQRRVDEFADATLSAANRAKEGADAARKAAAQAAIYTGAVPAHRRLHRQRLRRDRRAPARRAPVAQWSREPNACKRLAAASMIASHHCPREISPPSSTRESPCRRSQRSRLRCAKRRSFSHASSRIRPLSRRSGRSLNGESHGSLPRFTGYLRSCSTGCVGEAPKAGANF